MAKTLNAIAFDSAGKRGEKGEIAEQAEKDMDFRKDARLALGYRVDKARPNGTIEAKVWTNRGWLAYHLEDGQRKPSDGWRFNGKRYILVPIEKDAFTVKGRLKSGFKRGIYIVPDGSEALMFYRARRGDRRSTLIGVLKTEVKHNEDTEPDRVINRVFREKAARLFNYYLDQ